ncbi:HAD hydrolase family protein, partial [Patescibacteria group bacterium]|nr:HAD hydrolase family protein [Patescibacteria group bacterium]
FCENGHLCYKNDGLNCLIKKNALRQIEKVKKYVDREIKQKSARFCFSYPSSELVGEITVVIQEKEKNRSFKHRLDAFISKNSLDRLVVDELTHNRLSVSVKNINKNSAIEAYGLDLSDCYYFCDEKNDFKLAKTVVNKGGKIVCPANAIEELKNIAYYVSDKPHSYGVLDFLSSLFSNSLN